MKTHNISQQFMNDSKRGLISYKCIFVKIEILNSVKISFTFMPDANRMEGFQIQQNDTRQL